jgi:hypothetical protein
MLDVYDIVLRQYHVFISTLTQHRRTYVFPKEMNKN